MATNAVTQQSSQINSPLDSALLNLGDKIFKTDSRNRYAEDREWFLAALFYQMKQWVKEVNRRWQMIPQDPKKPIPMPVSDYYSKTINANANSLGAAIPEMVCAPNDQNSNTRRAAQAAENAFDEMDKESGMDILNPRLAKHTVLWGMGVTKETVDTSESSGMVDLPNVGLNQQSIKVCPNCGYMALGPNSGQQSTSQPPAGAGAGLYASGTSNSDTNLTVPAGQNPPVVTGAPVQGQPGTDICPDCGSQMVSEDLFDIENGGVDQVPQGKLQTEVVPILEIYLPRDCRDPNLSKRITHKFRIPQDRAKTKYPNAGDLPADDKREISQFYIESLRGLLLGIANEEKMVSFTEIWADWDQLDDDTKEAIEAEWGQEPSQILGYEQLTRIQAAKMYGVYWIFVAGKVVAKGENPWDGKKCFTFYPWEKDPASPYPMALAARLIPKQRQLNRLDCLMELSEQTHGVGKLMAPIQQMQNFKPTGNPVDVYWYDQADGKQKPEFVLPTPYGAALPAKRAAIIQDFRELGYTQGVTQGDNPGGGVSSFRGIAYLGAKAEENIQTQRFLWEQAHKLRKELLLTMARKVWDQPRKAKVAGFNGKFGMMQLTGNSMMGDFGIDVVKGSSRPKTAEEKLQALQVAVESGLADIQDSQTRDFALNELGVTEINQADHYNYEKADRDLEKLKLGMMPQESPFQKWDIWLRLLGQYSLTEEFEDLDPAIQHGILMYAQYCSDKLTAVTQGVPPDPMALNQRFAAAVSGNKPQNPLNGVPGSTQVPAAAETAATTQGNGLAHALSPAAAG